MKVIKNLEGKQLEDFIGEHKGLIAALWDRNNAYYCNTCDGLRTRGHTCHCFFCKGEFPDSDKHLDCPKLVK